MFCSKCGEKVMDGSKFCANCGAAIGGNALGAGMKITAVQRRIIIRGISPVKKDGSR